MNYKLHLNSVTPEALPDDLVTVFKYWDTLREGRIAPAWGEFKLQDLPSKALPWSIVIDVNQDPFELRYRFWGTGRTRLQDIDYSGKLVSEFRPKSIRDKNIKEYEEVIKRRSAIHSITEAVSATTGENVSYDFLRLPLSSDGETVDKIYAISHNLEARSLLHGVFGTEAPKIA